MNKNKIVAHVTPLQGLLTKINVGWVPITFWMDKIKKNENFYFLKVNHGIFDMMAKMGGNWRTKSPKGIASCLYPRRHAGNKAVPKPTYIDIMTVMINYIRNYDLVPPNIFIGLSNNNGIMTLGRNYDVLDVITKNKSDRLFLYGGLIRRYTVAGDISKLLKVIQDSGYHIHLIGPPWFSLYKKIFKFNNFTHYIIPRKNALSDLDSIINKVEKNLTGKDILFTSLTTGTFLFVKKLNKRGLLDKMSLIDLGRAFDWLIRDERCVKGQAWIRKSRQPKTIMGRLVRGIKKQGYLYGWKDRIINTTTNF